MRWLFPTPRVHAKATYPSLSLFSGLFFEERMCEILRSSMCNSKGTMSMRVVQCCVILLAFCANVHAEGMRASGSGPVVKKEERWPVVSNEYGQISAVRISDGINGSYLLHFFSLQPTSLLLPLLLNAHMLFYVHAGHFLFILSISILYHLAFKWGKSQF